MNNSDVIRNVSGDQKEILYNIMQLYNNGAPFECDMTASSLCFYKPMRGDRYTIPQPTILFDVFPSCEGVREIKPWGRLPLENGSIGSIVIDLPFIVSSPESPSVNKEGANLMLKRFHGYYPVDDLYASYHHWIGEAHRVLCEGGICVFKCQSTVSGGVQHNTEEWSFMCAHKAGFKVEDKFILTAKARLISSSKIKKQRHARKYTSVFYVFRKEAKRRCKEFDYFDMLNAFDNLM